MEKQPPATPDPSHVEDPSLTGTVYLPAGETLHLQITYTNDRDEMVTVHAEVVNWPAEWSRWRGHARHRTLLPGQSADVMLDLFPPENAAEGIYPIEIVLYLADGPDSISKRALLFSHPIRLHITPAPAPGQPVTLHPKAPGPDPAEIIAPNIRIRRFWRKLPSPPSAPPVPCAPEPITDQTIIVPREEASLCEAPPSAHRDQERGVLDPGSHVGKPPLPVHRENDSEKETPLPFMAAPAPAPTPEKRASATPPPTPGFSQPMPSVGARPSRDPLELPTRLVGDAYGMPSIGARASSNPLEHLPPAAERGLYPSETPPQVEPVDCTVFAPPETAPGDAVMIQVFVHIPAELHRAQETAVEFDADVRRRGTASLGPRVARGATLAFELSMPPLTLSEPRRELVWEGRLQSVQFALPIPRDLPPQKLVGTLLVFQESVPIGRVSFTLTVLQSGAAPDSHRRPSGEARRFQRAFISYASPDLPEVLRRLPMLSVAGIETFQDILNLKPGDVWLEKLHTWIDQSDLFLLFWSRHARESTWVRHEWEYALQKQETGFIHPVLLEGPPIPMPPPELGHLHFGDKSCFVLTSRTGTAPPAPPPKRPWWAFWKRE